MAWKTNRTYKVKAETGQSYTTPLVVMKEGKEVIITFGSDTNCTFSRWCFYGIVVVTILVIIMERIASSISKDIVVVPYGRRAFAAVKAEGEGDITKTNRLWTKDVGADVPSPIAHEKAYLITDRGHIYCDLESGIRFGIKNYEIKC